jgi:hypothetical protein|tara:strand:- start:27 stop:371 length:345 start_codon:yes stop_codon:yes gene_type:complete
MSYNPPDISNPIISLTQHLIDRDYTDEAHAIDFEERIIEGECFYTAGKRIDIDFVLDKAMQDDCIRSELEELLTGKGNAHLIANQVLTLRNYFQDHLDEATSMLVNGARFGDVE